ncbi:hypothetical protein [Methylomonas sp. AM2-LC]|uniref:hypothetical protein n=1 Tax=Methylomonas sp. AM2-LC TaxID=3153301 RepID=UPI00326490DD
MNNSKVLYRDIATGTFFLVGIFSFMSGAFVLSTLLFGMAFLSSNISFLAVTK